MPDLIALPEAEVLRARLVAVCDESHLTERLYPHLLTHAGTDLAPAGVVVALTVAVEAYVSSLGSQTAVLRMMLHSFVPGWIDAMVEDPAGRDEAHEVWRRSRDGEA